MFTVLQTSKQNARTGMIKIHDKKVRTPMYSMIYNFGGGASDIYRVASYLDLLEGMDIIMLNWYYLTGRGTFKVSHTEHLNKFEDIMDFLKFIREVFFRKGYVKKDYPKRDINWQPLAMLDSGSGNLIRDYAELKYTTPKIIKCFEKESSEYLKFGMNHSFDIVIGMDFAKKYTYKKGESENKHYKDVSGKLSLDLASNLKLLNIALDFLKENVANEQRPLVYAPLRGENPEDFVQYLLKVLELEEKKGIKFDGFAIAGIAMSNSRVKTALDIAPVVEKVRDVLNNNQDTRPIHALGVGGIFTIIPLVLGGADTFDCMTPWRRATDGSMENADKVFKSDAKGSFSKYLIPVLDSNFEIITENKKDLWKYVKLPKVPNDIVCDCDICRKFTIEEIKELYSNKGEDYYFARMLLYVHAILQHKYLCCRIQKDIEDGVPVDDFINELPDKGLKDDLSKVISGLKSGLTNFL